MIELLELRPIRKQPERRPALRHAQARRLGRALALEPKVLLLDEPMGGMNQAEKEEMARFVLEVNNALGHHDHTDRT